MALHNHKLPMHLSNGRETPVEVAREAWQTFENHPGDRYRWRGRGNGKGVLVAADGSEVASVVRARRRVCRVKVGDRICYEIDRKTARVTDSTTGALVSTIIGRHYDHAAGTQLKFEDGRVVVFPVYEGTERKIGASRRWRRWFGVMFVVERDWRDWDAPRAQLVARRTKRSQPTIVLCGDRTPQLLLLAVLGAPLIKQYFQTPDPEDRWQNWVGP